MIKKKELAERIHKVENKNMDIEYATKEIVTILGGELKYYSYSSPSIYGRYETGCVSQQIQAICDFLGIELRYPKKQVIKKQPEVVAVKKKNEDKEE